MSVLDKNNMIFNGTKLQVVRYGHNEDLKNDTLCFTDDTKELNERFDTLRDLARMKAEG